MSKVTKIVLTVENGDGLLPDGATYLENWLRRQGTFIRRERKNLAKVFRCRLSFEQTKKKGIQKAITVQSGKTK